VSERSVIDRQTSEVRISGPRIALTWSAKATRPADRYLEAIGEAGGVPLLMLPEDGLGDLPTVDGLVLTGGRDVNPARYGQEADPRAAATLDLDEADGTVVYESTISTLRRFKDDVREVAAGYECGIGLENYQDYKEGDVIQAFEVQEIAR